MHVCGGGRGGGFLGRCSRYSSCNQWHVRHGVHVLGCVCWGVRVRGCDVCLWGGARVRGGDVWVWAGGGG